MKEKKKREKEKKRCTRQGAGSEGLQGQPRAGHGQFQPAPTDPQPGTAEPSC